MRDGATAAAHDYAQALAIASTSQYNSAPSMHSGYHTIDIGRVACLWSDKSGSQCAC